MFWRIALVSLVPIVLLAQLAAQPAQDGKLERFEFVEPHMGTKFRIVLFAPDRVTAEVAAHRAFNRVAVLDGLLSDYKEDSELTRVSRHAGKGPIAAGPELFHLLERSQALAAATDGAFDVTVGPLVKLWRRVRRQKELPKPERVAEARKVVGYDKLHLFPVNRQVRLDVAGMQLDLGGIAKGYAADEALRVLRREGLPRALVAAGGDVVVGEPPPGLAAWRVGVAPLDDPNKPPTRFVQLRNAAVSTSGDAEQYLELDGKRHSHVLDPRTGEPLQGHRSVTVVAPAGITSDSLDTAVCVLGPEKGMPLIDATPGAAALFTSNSPTGPSVQSSARWQDFEIPAAARDGRKD